MSRVARYGFILAKIYGMVARSYVGKNYRDVLRLKKLTELRDLLFAGEKGETAEQALPEELEARIVEAGIASMRYVLDYLGEPVPILVHVLRRLEYQNVKHVIRGMSGGAVSTARLWDLGHYASVSLSDPGERESALKSSPYAWVLPLVGSVPLAQIENRLDQDYHEKFLSLAESLAAADRRGVVRLARQEIVLANVTWALRLRFYFGMEWERARKLLIPQQGDTEKQALARVFEIQPEAADEWRRWKYGWLLSDQLSEGFHGPDPLRAEQKASQALYVHYRQALHRDPFTLCPLVAFFKLKEHETALLKTAVEALQLAVPEQDVLAMVGAR